MKTTLSTIRRAALTLTFCSALAGSALAGTGGGTTTTSGGSGGPYPYPYLVPVGTKQVATSYMDTCAVSYDGQIKCWGVNDKGQLGIGSVGGEYNTPQSVSGIDTATQVAIGMKFGCATLADKSAVCWGDNSYGQLGDGTKISSSVPVTVPSLTSAQATQVVTGGIHACALVNFGPTVACWGANGGGQLGDGTRTNRSEPVIAMTGLAVKQISAGSDHTCALLTDGTLKCWGYNPVGQIGDGTTSDRLSPVTVLTGVVNVSTGDNHTCAALSSGLVKCWGWNVYGQLGDGTTANRSLPTTVVGVSGATKVMAGGKHSCALLSSGQLKCWGEGTMSELGNGASSSSLTAVTVSGVSDAWGVSVGMGDSFHSCVLRGSIYSGAELLCWGRGVDGELGLGGNSSKNVPTTVPITW